MYSYINRITLNLIALLAPLSAWAEIPEEVALDYCIRAIDDAPNRAPLTETLRVRVKLTGTLRDDQRQQVLTQLIQEKFWPGRAVKVYIEPYSEDDCQASANREGTVSIVVKPSDAEAIEKEVARGEGVLSIVSEMAQRATSFLKGDSKKEEANRAWVRVFYATNRQLLPGKDLAFGTELVSKLSYGAVQVAVERQPLMPDLESPSIVKFDRATSLDKFSVIGPPTLMSINAWRSELRQKASRFEKPGVLLFVHGYNVPFNDAARRSAQLAHDLAFTGPTVFFAWPSDASVIKYLSDDRDAENSWTAMTSVISDLVSLQPEGPVYIIAHSMGNRVLMGGLRNLAEGAGLPRALREIVLAAPDVDQISFRDNFANKILGGKPRFTLYASEHDLALGSSEFLRGGHRLGSGGKELYVSNQMDSVDASGVTKEFFALNHSYFGDKSVVLSDIFYVIRQSLAAAKRPNLSKGTQKAPTAWILQ